MTDHKSRIETLKAQIAAEKERLAKIRASVTDEEREEIELRRERIRAKAEAEAALREKLSEDLDRRLDAAEVEHPDKQFQPVMMKSFNDTFLVMRVGSAHTRWLNEMSKSLQGKGDADRAKINREYAIACIYDWNGSQDFDHNPDLTQKLRAYLTQNPGLVTPLTDAAAELSGTFASERNKSD